MSTAFSTNNRPAAWLPNEAIARLEAIAAHAWPAEQVEEVDGWRLRFAGGITRRANSVWPNADNRHSSLPAKLAAAERFYLSRGLPVVYQICAAAQPADLDDVLAADGYALDAPTWVQIAPINRLLEKLPPLRLHPEFEIEVAEEYDPAWFDLYCRSEGVEGHGAAMRSAILQRIEPPHGFVTLSIHGVPVAIGLGVLEDEWLGIFSMATLPAYRRRGAAAAVLRTLAIWAQLYDAKHAYLQVMQDNAGAQQLYAKAGFETAYSYHYRVKQ